MSNVKFLVPYIISAFKIADVDNTGVDLSQLIEVVQICIQAEDDFGAKLPTKADILRALKYTLLNGHICCNENNKYVLNYSMDHNQSSPASVQNGENSKNQQSNSNVSTKPRRHRSSNRTDTKSHRRKSKKNIDTDKNNDSNQNSNNNKMDPLISFCCKQRRRRRPSRRSRCKRRRRRRSSSRRRCRRRRRSRSRRRRRRSCRRRSRRRRRPRCYRKCNNQTEDYPYENDINSNSGGCDEDDTMDHDSNGDTDGDKNEVNEYKQQPDELPPDFVHNEDQPIDSNA